MAGQGPVVQDVPREALFSSLFRFLHDSWNAFAHGGKNAKGREKRPGMSPSLSPSPSALGNGGRQALWLTPASVPREGHRRSPRCRQQVNCPGTRCIFGVIHSRMGKKEKVPSAQTPAQTELRRLAVEEVKPVLIRKLAHKVYKILHKLSNPSSPPRFH